VEIDALAEKLWLASKIQGHRNPFGKSLTEYTPLELDFVLEMAARDDPEHLTFVRRGASKPVAHEIEAAWDTFYTGPARVRYLAKSDFADAIAQGNANMRRLREKRAKAAPVKPMITRGGKEITGAGNPNRG
jgi:hypothetical protein